MKTTSDDAPSGRLPLLDPSTMVEAQQDLYGSIIKDNLPWADDVGLRISIKEGRLVGPFNAFLLNPEITEALLAFDTALKNHCSFSDRVREVVILAVGGVWGARYELYTHSMLGRRAGIPPEAIRALASGELPEMLPPDELLAARVARGLATNHRIDDTLFAEAESTFGKQGLNEIATLAGEFSVTCTILKLFDVPVPGLDV